MDGFSVNEDHGTFGANFIPNNTFRIILNTDYHYTISYKYKVVTTTSMDIGWISNSTINDFFYFFGGGSPGLRGYTFYDTRLTGPQKLIFSNVIRFPIFKEKNYNLGHISFQNLSAGIVNQIAKAFNYKNENILIEDVSDDRKYLYSCVDVPGRYEY